jgi:glycosyl transferase family 25
VSFFTRRKFGQCITEFFDRIYCINLDTRPDRWKYVSAHFRKFGLHKNVERFSAIDIRSNPKYTASEKLLRDNFSLLAMCGCLLSHRALIQKARENGLKNVLVLEDDVKFVEDNVRGIPATLDQLSRTPWDIFYLGATYLFKTIRISDVLIQVPNGAYATHAIAYNHTIFDEVLETLPDDPQSYLTSEAFEVNALDKWLQAGPFERSRFYGANPIMAVQGLQESDIASNQAQGIEETQMDLFIKNLESQNEPS